MDTFASRQFGGAPLQIHLLPSYNATSFYEVTRNIWKKNIGIFKEGNLTDS